MLVSNNRSFNVFFFQSNLKSLQSKPGEFCESKLIMDEVLIIQWLSVKYSIEYHLIWHSFTFLKTGVFLKVIHIHLFLYDFNCIHLTLLVCLISIIFITFFFPFWSDIHFWLLNCRKFSRFFGFFPLYSW